MSVARRTVGGWAVLLLAAPAGAQTLPSPADPRPATPPPPQPAGSPDRVTGRRTYDAAYFAQFAPATALQIVERVPGFSIEQVDPSVRGFGQSAGNVVINGQRPSSKTDTVETILARIPASRVLRVEVGTGDLFAAEYTGKSQVLNLVTTTAGGASATLEGGVMRDFTGKLFPQGSVSALVRRGPSTFNASLTIKNEEQSEEGYDRVTTLPGAVETEYRDKFNHISDPNAALAASWDYDGGTNRTAHLNIRAFRDRFVLTQDNRVTRPGLPARQDFLSQHYDTDQVELGGDVTRPLAGGGLKLIGLLNRRFRDLNDVSLLGQAGDGFTQRLQDTLEESLARLVWNRSAWGGWNVEAGAEGVINRLDSANRLFELSPGAPPLAIDLPVDQAVVKEVRGEAFLNAGRALSANLRVDGALTYELSSITVSGDAQAERTLKFLKPKLVIDWRPGAKWHAQLSLQRTVAQLQFEDFIGSAELASDRVNGGNAQLVPQRSWEALATIERTILAQGLWRLEAGYTRTSLVQDRVPTPEGFDAPGNLGTGRSLILRSRVEAPLSTLGFKGGRLILYGSYVGTAVTDPYTGRSRPYSGNAAFYGEATLRQDLTLFAWGLSLEGATPSTFYRLDEEDRGMDGFPYLTAFVEWRPAPATTVTLTVENAALAAFARERRFFDPDRRTRAPYLREYRWRTQHITPSLTFKTFG